MDETVAAMRSIAEKTSIIEEIAYQLHVARANGALPHPAPALRATQPAPVGAALPGERRRTLRG